MDNSCSNNFMNKELYILTGTETKQLFCHMFVTLKIFKELFHLT